MCCWQHSQSRLAWIERTWLPPLPATWCQQPANSLALCGAGHPGLCVHPSSLCLAHRATTCVWMPVHQYSLESSDCSLSVCVPVSSCRALALRCVVQVMASLSRLPPADARVYNDYLLPSLSLLPNDPEESVRVAYAQALAQLAAAAHEHLLAMQYGTAAEPLQQQGSGRQRQQPAPRSSSGQQPEAASSQQAAGAAAEAAAGPAEPAAAGAGPQPAVVRYDAEMEAVRSAIEKVVLELVAGLKSSPDIKRGLLSHAGQLGLFFGRRATTDQLLPPLYTCLNDHVEWRLRSSFYGAIAALGPHTGHLDIFMLPYLEQVGAVQGRGDILAARGHVDQ